MNTNLGTLTIAGKPVNRLGFGAMRITGQGVWGEPDDHDNAVAVLRRAVELGVNFIDTADAYGPETSENLIREALHPYDGLVVATKGGMTRQGPGLWTPDGRPEHLREALEASLQRLGVESIDLYQLHRPDPNVPFPESLKTLVQLKRAGKIKALGVSNVTLEQLLQARELTEIASVQNHYNIGHRVDGEDLLKFCEQENIQFIPYFPIGGNGQALESLREVAEKHGATERQIALAWLLAHSPVMLPIPGTSSIEHLEENIAAGDIVLDDDDMTVLDALPHD